VLPRGVVGDVAEPAAAHRGGHGEVEVAGAGRRRADGADQLHDLARVPAVGAVAPAHVVEQVGVGLEPVDHLDAHERFQTVEDGTHILGIGDGDG
jgi:hypothetical protein